MRAVNQILDTTSLVACHECDQLYRETPLADGETARCGRCGNVLFEQKHDSLNRSLMYAMAAFIFFILANCFTVMTIHIEGVSNSCTLIGASRALYLDGMWHLAIVVFMFTVVVPALKLFGKLYVLVPLKMGRRPPQISIAIRLTELTEPWSMPEVFMLGVLVSITKLGQMATVELGLSFWALALMIITSIASGVVMDPRLIWRKTEAKK